MTLSPLHIKWGAYILLETRKAPFFGGTSLHGDVIKSYFMLHMNAYPSGTDQFVEYQKIESSTVRFIFLGLKVRCQCILFTCWMSKNIDAKTDNDRAKMDL